ncbi:MAG: hypothetical protein R3286_01080 [Gammaproteobacteria bacterium]|nr:hypothetical protein [Gammaproteobacteria bacterium]
MTTNAAESALDESTIVGEIAYYERQAAAARFLPHAESHFVRDRYLSFARRRRQLLAAFRDGRPGAWRRYGPASTCGCSRPASHGE